MTIELKNISQNMTLSEETPCYSAKLYWNGVAVAEVSNHGHGGCDMVRVLRDKEAAFAEAEAFVKAMPPLKSKFSQGGDLPMDLELWCHVEVGKVEERKAIRHAFRKDVKKAIVFVKEGALFTTTYKGVKQIEPKHIAHFKNARPGCQILNDMPEDKALAIYSDLAVAR